MLTMYESLSTTGVKGFGPHPYSSFRRPFSTPSEFSEERILEIAKTASDQTRKLLELATAVAKVAKNKIPLILVSHAPPIGTKVDSLNNITTAGSQAIRTFIEVIQPYPCVCGHIFEAAGFGKIGRTRIISPGTLSSGGWLEIDLANSELQVTLHDSFKRHHHHRRRSQRAGHWP